MIRSRLSSSGQPRPKTRRSAVRAGATALTAVRVHDRVFALQNGLPSMNNYIADKQVYRTTQTVTSSTPILATSTTVPTFAATSFFLSQCDNVTAFQSVFDQYKIEEVEVWVLPNVQENQDLSKIQALYRTSIDYDDANVPTSIASINEFNNCMTAPYTLGQYRVVKPHVAISAYQGAFTGFANQNSQWIDIGSPNVQHFGFKMAADVTSSAVSFQITYRFHLAFRNVR